MLDHILSILKPHCKVDPVVDETASPKAIKISPQDLVAVMEVLFRNPATYFDMLSCITGIDNGVQAATMEVAYNLYSIPFNQHLMIKVTVPRDKPAVDSLSHCEKQASSAALQSPLSLLASHAPACCSTS